MNTNSIQPSIHESYNEENDKREAALASIARTLEAWGRSVDLMRKATITVGCGNSKGCDDKVTRGLHAKYDNSKGDEKDERARGLHVKYDNSKGVEKDELARGLHVNYDNAKGVD